jgi:hypothetical protein
MYRWMKVVNGETTYSMGIIPGNEVTISNDKVSFQTTKFGVFQLAKSEAKITERVNVPTIQPPALKKDAGNPLIGKWGICSSEASRGDNSKWGSDPLQVSMIMGGNNEPTSSQGNYGPGFYGFGANLNWQGGRSPFKVERSFDNFATSSVVAPQLNNWNLQDASIPAGKTSAQYRITDSSGNSAIAATHIPKYLKVTNVQTTDINTSITWSSNGSNFKVYEWGQDNCSGSKTEKYSGQVTNAIIAFGSKLMLSLSVQDTDAGTSSQCLTIMRRGDIDVVTSRIEPSASDTSKFKLTLKWLGTPTTSFTLQRFSDATCQTVDGSSTSVATNSYTMDDLAQGSQFFVNVSSGAIFSRCLPIKIPGGGSPAAEIKVNLVETSAPAYDSTQGRVSLSWESVPEKTRFKVLKFGQADCYSVGQYIFSSDDQNRMFTDNNPESGNYSYIVETEGLTTNKKSDCINVNMPEPAVFQRFPSYINITRISANPSSVELIWDGGMSPYTVSLYQDQSCQTFKSSQISSSGTATVTPANNTIEYAIVKDTWGNSSRCVAVSATRTQDFPMTAISANSTGQVNLKWTAPNPLPTNIVIKKFNSPSCSSAIGEIPLSGNALVNYSEVIPTGSGDFFYYQVQYSGTSFTTKFSGCTPVEIPRLMDHMSQPVAWTSVTTSGRSVSLSWFGNFSGLLKYYEAASCSGTPQTFDVNGQQMIEVAALKPSTAYSFKIDGTINGTPAALPCITAITTSFDPFMLTAAEAYSAEISVPITINIKTDETHDIMLESRGQTMSNQKWTSISKSNNGSTTLKISGSTLIQANAQLSLRTTNNCYFTTGGVYFSDILLTNANTKLTAGTTDKYSAQLTDLAITCNSGNNNGGDGGGGNFGPPGDSSMFSERMILVIAPGGFTMIEDKFLSADCTKNRVSSRTELGAFVLPGQDSVVDTHPVDVTPKELNGIFFMQEMVDRANSDPEQFACGVGGWVLSKSQNLTNTKCASTGKTDYIRLKVVPSQSVGDRLYLCDNPDMDSEYGKTAATRIPTCDITSESFYFKRQ